MHYKSLLINRLWAQYLQLFESKMTTMRDVSNIAKFIGQNLPTLKLGCWILFQQHNLVKLVIGEDPLPVETRNAEGVVTNAAARDTWLEKDLLARSFFIATIEIPQQRTLVNCNTAHEMWLRISAQHLQNAADNQHALEHRFFEYRFQPEPDVMSHITEIETIANQLRDINAPVTESQLMTKIICTLPPSYRGFMSAWDSVPVAERTIDSLTSCLLKEESMTKQWSKGKLDSQDAAFFAHNFPSYTTLI